MKLLGKFGNSIAPKNQKNNTTLTTNHFKP
ncbi:MAG: hypothetical protein ACJAVY_000281 [Marinoscillum sp.]|jgi:hypothetical protein